MTMLNSSAKNKIYAAISIFVIILVIACFIAVAGFLMKINALIFSIDKKLVEEKTTVVDTVNYNAIKEKIETRR